MKSTRIENAGAGLPAGSDEAGFQKGFVLASGGLEGQQIWIVQGDTLINVRLDSDSEGGWKATQRELTSDELGELKGFLKRLSWYLGYSYSEPFIHDGEQLTLFETADGRGRPVLHGNNAQIWSLTGLAGRLDELGREGAAVEMDEETEKVRDRVLKGL